MQPGCHAFAEGSLTDNAIEHADGSDADLHRREKLVRITEQRQRRLRPLVALFGHGIQAHFAAGRQGQFRHGKDTVEQSQEDNQQEIHCAAAKINICHFT